MASFVGWCATIRENIDCDRKWAIAEFVDSGKKYYCVADRDSQSPYCSKHVKNTQEDVFDYINSVYDSTPSLCHICSQKNQSENIGIKVPTALLPVTDFPSAVIKYIRSIKNRALEEGKKEKKAANVSWNTLVVKQIMENELPAEVTRMLNGIKNPNIIEIAGMLAVFTLEQLWVKIAEQEPILQILDDSMRNAGYKIEANPFKKFIGFFKKDASNIALYIESDANNINKKTNANPIQWKDEVNRKKQAYIDAFRKYLWEDQASLFGAALACAIIASKIIEFTSQKSQSEKTANLVRNLLRGRSGSKSQSSTSDWVEGTDKEGNTYYYNLKTKKSQWEKPNE